MLLVKAIEHYLKHLQIRECSKETIRGYRILLLEIQRYLEAHHNCALFLEDVSVEDIDLFFAYRKEMGDIPSSRNRHYYILSGFFNYLLSRSMIETNIMSNITPVKVNTRERRYLQIDQIEALIDASKPAILQVAVTALAYTGLRVSELCSLKNADVDLHRRIIKVNGGKGDKDRVVPISEKLYQILTDYVTRLKPRTRTDYFFATHKNPKITDDYINRVLKQAAIDIGLDFKPTAHTLRHSFASALVEKNASLASVQKILGHADLRITSRYIHQSFDQIKDAVDLM